MSSVHYYGDEKFDWQSLSDAIDYIELNLTRWGRINVRQAKEKFGQARIYCGIGISSFHSIIWPRHVWIHRWWPYWYDMQVWHFLNKIFGRLIVKYQSWVYTTVYYKATKKWPHIKKEITYAADYRELLPFIKNYELEDWHWPYQRINSGGAREYECPHGIGHGGVHGCDGCCSHESYRSRGG